MKRDRLVIAIVDAQHMLEQADSRETLRESNPAHRGDQQVRPGGTIMRRPGAKPPKRKCEAQYPVQPAQVRFNHDWSLCNGTAKKTCMFVRSDT